MKLALLGSSPLALETAVRFYAHGGSVTWFRDPAESEFLPLTTPSTWKNTTTPQGLELLGSPDVPSEFSHDHWKAFYRDPLIGLMSESLELKPFKVLSITKRFLRPQENPGSKSRFLDLFRLIYQLNPSEFVEKQKESDPEMYERLSQEMVDSLQSTIEMYDDFDLVIDLRAALVSGSLNESGRALGEHRVSADKVSRGLSVLKDLSLYTTDKNVREMILVGSSEIALEAMIKLQAWVKNPVNRLFVSTAEETPFAAVLESSSDEVKKAFELVMSDVQAEWEKEMTSFHEKLREWQALDDFVQAKIPRPAEPIPQVNFFSGHNATAIDQLIDRKRLFVTLESPDFREGKWQPENNLLELKTLGVDHVLIATQMLRENITMLDSQETGYFPLTPSSANSQSGWEKDLSAIKGIEDEIFKLFSPAHSS